MVLFFFALALPLDLIQAASFTCPPVGPDPKCDIETEIFCPGVTWASWTYMDGHTAWRACPSPGYCIPMFDVWYNDTDGNPCPMTCPRQCNYEAKETMCPGPHNANGCYSAANSFCVPFNTKTNCFGTSPISETCDGKICPGGNNPSDGCPISDYCALKYDDCPAMCYPQTCNWDAGEQFCDNGTDENDCWMGAYCAVTCHN